MARRSVVTLLATSDDFALLKSDDGWKMLVLIDGTILFDRANLIVLTTFSMYGYWEHEPLPRGSDTPEKPPVPTICRPRYGQTRVSGELEGIITAGRLTNVALRDLAQQLVRDAKEQGLEIDFFPWVQPLLPEE